MILLWLDIADGQKDLDPQEVQMGNRGVKFTCANYLFLLINNDILSNNTDGEWLFGERGVPWGVLFSDGGWCYFRW